MARLAALQRGLLAQRWLRATVARSRTSYDIP